MTRGRGVWRGELLKARAACCSRANCPNGAIPCDSDIALSLHSCWGDGDGERPPHALRVRPHISPSSSLPSPRAKGNGKRHLNLISLLRSFYLSRDDSSTCSFVSDCKLNSDGQMGRQLDPSGFIIATCRRRDLFSFPRRADHCAIMASFGSPRLNWQLEFPNRRDLYVARPTARAVTSGGSGERLEGTRVVYFRFFCPYARYIINCFWFVCPENELFLRPGGPDARIAETYGLAPRSTCSRCRRRRRYRHRRPLPFSSSFSPSFTRGTAREGSRDSDEGARFRSAMTQLRKCYRYYVILLSPGPLFVARMLNAVMQTALLRSHAMFIFVASTPSSSFSNFGQDSPRCIRCSREDDGGARRGRNQFEWR